jgi:hypothetical protein
MALVTGRAAVLPVTSSGSGTWVATDGGAGLRGATGAEAVKALPAMNEIAPTAIATKPAPANTVILRITIVPRRPIRPWRLPCTIRRGG